MIIYYANMMAMLIWPIHTLTYGRTSSFIKRNYKQNKQQTHEYVRIFLHQKLYKV